MLITNLIAQIAFGLTAMTICLPSMQEWSALFGASQARVQLTFSGFVMAFTTGLITGVAVAFMRGSRGNRPVQYSLQTAVLVGSSVRNPQG